MADSGVGARSTVYERPVGTHLHAADPFLPGAEPRAVDLVQGLVGQLQVHALGGDGELEGHGLVGLCHLWGGGAAHRHNA